MKKTTTQKTKQQSVRTKLISIMLLVSIVPLLVAVAISYNSSTNSAEETAKQNLNWQAKYIESEVDKMLIKAETSLGSFASSPETIAFLKGELEDSSVVKAQMVQINESFNDDNTIVMSNANGDMVLRSDDGELKNIGERDYFQAAIKGETYVSNVFVSSVTNSRNICVAVPIYDTNGTTVTLTTKRSHYYELKYWLDGDGNKIYPDGRLEDAEGSVYGPFTGSFVLGDKISGASSVNISNITESSITVEMSDFITIYDASTRVFSGGGYYMMINSSKTAIAPYEVYAGVTFTPGEMSATPMAPQVASFRQHDEGFDGNGSLQMMIMPYDEQYNALPTDKVFFEVIKKYADREELLVFTKADYPNIQQEMTMVPYGYTENWSLLFEDGRYGIELFNVDYPTIGVRTVFTGGGEENRSATTWLDCEDFVPVEQDPTAIAQHPSTLTQQPTYTDAQGRSVAPNAKGLVIKTVTLADGTRKSMKFMQR